MLTQQQAQLAANTLNIVGLDKPRSIVLDANDKEVALDRVSQRMESWLAAEHAKENLVQCNCNAMREQIIKTALAYGYFSIWMAVFDQELDMKLRFIEAFTGTKDSGCFDSTTANLVTPAPNFDSWNHGSKA